MDSHILNSPEKYSTLYVESPRKQQSQAPQTWEIGQIIDEKYEILDILIKDQKKIIYKVRHCQWNIPLAVRSQIEKESQVKFFHQAERWVELGKHPNIVSAYYVQHIGGLPRLFVEYVTNAKTLQQFITLKNADIQTILDIAIQICWGMQHAHQKGVLHGDLRPANIFLTNDGDVKIADFRSREGVALDSTPYMPPEQFEKDVLMQTAIDIYSFGAVLYELCTGELPVKLKQALISEESLQEFRNLILTMTLIPPHQIVPQIPQALSDLILQCLDVEISKRPKDFAQIVSVLQKLYIEVTGFHYPREAPEPTALMAVDLNNRALSLLDLQEDQKAEKYLEEAIEADNMCTGALINLYLLRLRKGKTGLVQFRNETQRLLDIDREVVTFYRSKIALEQGGFLDEAIQEVEQACPLFPHNKELQRLRASLYLRLGRYSEASDILQELCNTDNPSKKDLYHLGCAYLYDNRRKQAQDLWAKALTLYPHDLDFLVAQAITTAMLGKVEDAYQQFQQLATGSEKFWPNLHLAEINAGFGRYVSGYDKASPNLEVAHKLYEMLQTKASELPRVIHGYSQIFNPETDKAIVHPTSLQGILPAWGYARSLDGHTQGIHCLALSPDGKLVLVGGGDNQIRIWDIETGQCDSTLTGHSDGTIQAAISQDGHFAVTTGRDSTALVWDLVSGECVARLEGHVRDITAIALTNTGYLVSGSLDKTLRIWDLGSLSCRKILRGHSDKINFIATTPDGHYAISASEDHLIGIWDVEQGDAVRFLEGHTEGVTSLAMSPAGEWFASTSWDQKIRIWEVETGKCLHVLEGHTGTINCLAITTAGDHIISGSEDKTIRVWNVEDGQCLQILKGHKVDVTCLAIGAHDTMLVSGSWDHTVRVWHLPSGQCLTTLEGHTDLVNVVAITPDDRFIISCGDDPFLRIWRDITTMACPPLEEPKLAYLLQSPRSQQGNFEAQRRVEKLIAQAEAKIKDNQIVEAMQIYREVQHIEGFHSNPKVLNAIYGTAQQGKLLRKKPISVWKRSILEGHTDIVTCLALSPKEDIVVSGSKDHSLGIWNIEDGSCVSMLKGHRGPVTFVDISPNGRFVISASQDKTLRLWEMETGRCIHCMEGHDLSIEQVLFTPDGRRVISGSRDNTIKIWERKNGHRLYSLNNHTDLISGLKITPDGQYIISCSHDRTIRTWELESGQCLQNLEKHTEHVKCLACHPTKPYLLSGGWDGRLCLWDIQKGDCIREYEGHESWINSIAITPDGTKAISCSLDKKLRIWDLETAQCLQVLKGHTQDVNCFALMDQGHFIVSGSWDKTLRVWDTVSSDSCCVLEGHTAEITAVLTLSNSRFVVSASRDSKIIIWEFDWNWDVEKHS